MDILPRLLAGAVGAVVAWAGANKVTDMREWRDSARAQGVHPVIALVLPVIELILGVALVVMPVNAVVLGAVTLLLVVFTAWLAVQVAGGATVPCACFGARSVRPPSRSDIARNLVMIAALFAAAALR